MHYEVAIGTTYCPDTPENRRNFEHKKAAIQAGTSRVRKPTTAEEVNQVLQQQISRENKQLRSLRQYLPGHEPR